MTFSEILATIALGSSIPPLVVTIHRFRQLSGAGLLLGIYCVFLFLIEIIQKFISKFGQELFGTNNNLWTVHLSSIGEFIFFSFIYLKIFSSKHIRQFILWMLPLAVVVSLVDAFYLNNLRQFNTFAFSVHHILLICYAVLYFDKIFRELKVKRLEQDPMFLFNAASLIYFSGSILINSFSNILIETSMEAALAIYGIYAILFALYLSVLALAVWYAGRQEPTPALAE